MDSRGDSGLTSAVLSRGLSPKEPDAWDVCTRLGLGEEIGYGAAAFVDVTVRTRSMTAAPAILVLQRVQFTTATGLRKCAKWASALDASASKAHFAIVLCRTGAVLAACSSISLSPIWASYILSGRGQT